MADRTTVRASAIDRAIAVVSPRAAMRRLAARAAFAEMARGYDGGARSARDRGWRATGSSADAEIAAFGKTLRERSREQRRNNPLYNSGVTVWTNSLVGEGIRPRFTTPDAGLNAMLNEAWEDLVAQIDADGHSTFYALQTLAVSEMIEAGEVFVRRRIRRQSDMREVDGRPVVPLQIQLYEADHLDETKEGLTADGRVIRGGIEYDAIGRRAAYWMFPEHPGDIGVTRGFAARLESVRVPASEIAHLFERQRVQSRGVPWGHAVLRALKDLSDSADAERMARKIAACVAGFIIPGDNEGEAAKLAPSLTDADGNKVDTIRPGLLAFLHGGKDVKFNTPAATQGVSEWIRTQVLPIAAGWLMPFEMLIGDLSGVNYSSYKAGDVKFKRLATARQQQVVIPMLCDRVADWFVEAGYIAGMWPVATASREWDVPAFEEADRLKEFAADLLEVRAGFATRSQKISARGYDPLTIDEETAADNARADDLGLTLDSDPRRTAKAGSVQPTDQAASASDDGQRESGARALGDLDVNELIKLARAIIESEHGAQAPPQTSHAPARKRKAS